MLHIPFLYAEDYPSIPIHTLFLEPANQEAAKTSLYELTSCPRTLPVSRYPALFICNQYRFNVNSFSSPQNFILKRPSPLGPKWTFPNYFLAMLLVV